MLPRASVRVALTPGKYAESAPRRKRQMSKLVHLSGRIRRGHRSRHGPDSLSMPLSSFRVWRWRRRNLFINSIVLRISNGYWDILVHWLDGCCNSHACLCGLLLTCWLTSLRMLTCLPATLLVVNIYGSYEVRRLYRLTPCLVKPINGSSLSSSPSSSIHAGLRIQASIT